MTCTVLNIYSNSHASIDPAVRAARGLPEDLIRLCVGIEDADDLIEDLEFSLLKAGAITQVPQPQGGMAFTRLRDASDFGGLVGVALEKLTNNIGGLRLDASLGHGLSSSAAHGRGVYGICTRQNHTVRGACSCVWCGESQISITNIT